MHVLFQIAVLRRLVAAVIGPLAGVYPHMLNRADPIRKNVRTERINFVGYFRSSIANISGAILLVNWRVNRFSWKFIVSWFPRHWIRVLCYLLLVFVTLRTPLSQQ